MKYVTAGVALMLVASLGCDSTTTTGQGGKKLTILKPADQTLERGKTNDIAITVNRSGFDAPVSVRFEGLPKGVAVLNPDERITSDPGIVNYRLSAAVDADLVTNHVCRVTALGPEGMAATETFQLTVKEGPAGGAGSE